MMLLFVKATIITYTIMTIVCEDESEKDYTDTDINYGWH